MASFEQRNNSWRAIVRLPGDRKLTGTFDTKAEAAAWAAREERTKNILRGSGHDVLAQDMFEGYLASVASKTDSSRWNRYRILAWGRDPIAKVKIGEVTIHHVNEWIARRMQAVSGSSVNRELNLMSGAFGWAVKDRKWIPVNPCHGARRPENNRARNRRLLTKDEITAICTATGYVFDTELRTLTARTGAAFLLAMETGMRSGEILRLRPEDYRKALRTVRVTASEPGGRKSSRSGRSRVDSGRHVPLTARAMELLDQLLVGRDPAQPYIVGLTDGQRDALWRKAIKQATVHDLHFHDTKHEAATRLSKFLDVLALSHALGTKDIKLLRDTYYVNDAAAAAALLPARLSL
jgi:integrase